LLGRFAQVRLEFAEGQFNRFEVGRIIGEILPTYHPLRLAEEICMLDQISRGRVEFGVGRGIVPHELALFGIDPLEAPDIMKEAFGVLMSALTQDSVSHRGHYYKFFNVPMEGEELAANPL
jgi:alkanesulfonate monooxygenase SsuD/methylene tetrahydromethanopterin reductase-like flavin-dependent oxidoreductase (luciferase family)